MDAAQKDAVIKESKRFRKYLDEIRRELRATAYKSRERSLAYTKLQESIMWLGLDLRELNDGVSCFTQGYNPDNATVEDVPDGVHMDGKR